MRGWMFFMGYCGWWFRCSCRLSWIVIKMCMNLCGMYKIMGLRWRELLIILLVGRFVIFL